MPVLLIFAFAVLGVVVHDVLRRGSFRRLAVRNVVRRRNEAMLVVLGCLLGTAIITSSFVVGDTFDASISDVARTGYGPVDVTVRRGLSGADELYASVGDRAPAGADGMVRYVEARTVLATAEQEGTDRRAVPDALIGEIDFDAARSFGGDEAITGLADAGATPAGDEIVINEETAEELDAAVGDEVVTYVLGQPQAYTVRDVVPVLGMAGFAGAFVPPGSLAAAREAAVAETGGTLVGTEPSAVVLASVDGGVFDTIDADPVVVELEGRTASVGGIDVLAAKEELLDRAAEESSGLQGLFAGIGGFSVIAGILLLVNLFVMLSEERKTELGMLRAVGYKRNHLMRTFALEGAMYAVAAAVLGAAVGVGVGWVVVTVAGSIFSPGDLDVGLQLSVQPSSLVTGALIGLIISMLTVWATSARISRLNVIAAIRDLPEPRRTGRQRRTLVLAGAGIALGALLLVLGVTADAGIPAIAGVPCMAFSAVPLLNRRVGSTAAAVGAAVITIVWGVGVFSFLPEAVEGGGIELFVVQGVVLVAAAVVITTSADHLWVRLVVRLSGTRSGLAARLGLAYPVARRFRTGMLLAMFALVIFTMTFLSTFAGIFASQATQVEEEASGGFDAFVDSSSSNPPDVDALLDVSGVDEAVPVVRAFPEFTAEHEPDRTTFSISGVDEGLLQSRAPKLESRGGSYADDEAAFEAVIDDPSLAIVHDTFLQDGGPASGSVEVGDEIVLIDQAGGERPLEVVGVFESDVLYSGVFVSRALVADALGTTGVANRHLVSVDAGADPEVVADRITGALVANGAEATTFRSEIEDSLSESTSFFNLMRGYLGLGLIIGIAGLGVVMIRAVRERRIEVGMLRAMGIPAGVVSRAFLVEAAFIALQGIAIGIALGMVSSYQVLVNSDTFGETSLPFSVPWLALAVIVALPLVASLVATVAPAAQAARIKPAAALRMTD